MHVCLICVEIFAWGKYGGYGRTTRALGRELVRSGVEVTAVVPRRQDQGVEEQLDGIRVLSFPMSSPWRAQELFERCNADVYHSQEPSFGTFFARRAQPRAKHVVTVRDPKFLRDWLVELRYPSISLARTFLSRFYDINRAVRSAVQRADRVLACTFEGREKARSLYGLGRLPAFMPSPVAVPEAAPRKRTRPTVCMVGRWDKRKRPELFFELSRRHPDIDFIAVGKSHDAERERRLRERYGGLPNLDLVGWIDQFRTDALYEILAESWIVVNTSAREGLPTSILEAMACGCAVLSSVNPDDLAERFGVYVEHGDFDAGLLALLEGERWRALGEAARQYVATHYEMRDATRRHQELYRELLAGAG